MFWPWIRLREGLRWLFRGSHFKPLERDIDRMAAPLHRGVSPRQAARIRRHVRHAIGWLPAERAALYHEMMARAGHPTKES